MRYLVPLLTLLAADAPTTDGLSPAKSLVQFDHPDDLEVTLFAAEPLIKNPTSIDIDARGRVWVFEAVNYRHFRNTDKPLREAGDRILILEDTDHDGRADKSTTFYQGRELDGGHGVCVLGNKAIVTTPGKVLLLTDTDGDDRADKKELLFSCAEGVEHDHGLHAFKFGPDGKLYSNFGNKAGQLRDQHGKTIIDLAGNEINDDGTPYRQGMVFRCDLDGSNVETLGWNFRNPWEVAVDSYGNIWQSDNDDDGNRSTRINFVMEFGNYGYVDEMTGAGWRSQPQTGDKPLFYYHWHLGDPGVVPNLLNTGAGAPTGILFYEGNSLPARFHNAIIHADALPNVVRAYPIQPDGAGYKATIEPIIDGSGDKWFRPSDVCIAPDGSLFVADWYDAGVGGHRMADIDQGRIFRMTTPENADSYKVPEFDFETPEGAAQALTNPALSVRYLAWTALVEMGARAEPALEKLWQHENPRFRARALWVLGQGEDGPQWVEKAIQDENPNIRITAIRLARQLAHDGKLKLPEILEQIVGDENPQVRRTAAIALREVDIAQAEPLWETLADQYRGQDRWYLEALGIAADGRWTDIMFDTGFSKTPGEPATPESLEASLDVIWRSRSRLTTYVIQMAIISGDIPEGSLPRFFRALDFQPPNPWTLPFLELALKQPLDTPRSKYIATEFLRRVEALNLEDPQQKTNFERLITSFKGTPQFVEFVNQFNLTEYDDELIALAIENPNNETGIAAVQSLFKRNQSDKLIAFLNDAPPEKAAKLAQAIGNTASGEAVEILLPIVGDDEADLETRRQSVAGLARTRGGANRLLKIIEQDQLDSALEPAAEAALKSNTDPALQAKINKAFPPPPGSENPLPPIAELVKRRGDANKGRLVYLTEGTCVKCHQYMGIGKNVGPDLAEIGDKLSRQALYESILYPSAGISHNYASYVAVTAEGTVVTGLLISETPEEVVLKGADGIERAFQRDELLEFVKQDVSLMPNDIQRLITEEQLVNLVEFLTTLK